MKVCSRCRKEKPLDRFYKCKGRPQGVGCYCKQCTKEMRQSPEWKQKDAAARAKRYRDNPEKYRGLSREWYAAHKEQRLARARMWKENHRDRVSEYSAEYYAKHNDERRAYSREWRGRNRAAAIDRARRWRNNNLEKAREYSRQYHKTHPEQNRMHGHNRRARMKKLVHQLTPKEWRWLVEASGHRCVYCGKHETQCGGLHQDHVVPVTQGGPYTISNIVPVCKSCNSRKRDRTPEQAGMTMVVKVNPLKKLKQKRLFDE